MSDLVPRLSQSVRNVHKDGRSERQPRETEGLLGRMNRRREALSRIPAARNKAGSDKSGPIRDHRSSRRDKRRREKLGKLDDEFTSIVFRTAAKASNELQMVKFLINVFETPFNFDEETYRPDTRVVAAPTRERKIDEAEKWINMINRKFERASPRWIPPEPAAAYLGVMKAEFNYLYADNIVAYFPYSSSGRNQRDLVPKMELIIPFMESLINRPRTSPEARTIYRESIEELEELIDLARDLVDRKEEGTRKHGDAWMTNQAKEVMDAVHTLAKTIFNDDKMAKINEVYNRAYNRAQAKERGPMFERHGAIDDDTVIKIIKDVTLWRAGGQNTGRVIRRKGKRVKELTPKYKLDMTKHNIFDGLGHVQHDIPEERMSGPAPADLNVNQRERWLNRQRRETERLMALQRLMHPDPSVPFSREEAMTLVDMPSLMVRDGATFQRRLEEVRRTGTLPGARSPANTPTTPYRDAYDASPMPDVSAPQTPDDAPLTTTETTSTVTQPPPTPNLVYENPNPNKRPAANPSNRSVAARLDPMITGHDPLTDPNIDVAAILSTPDRPQYMPSPQQDMNYQLADLLDDNYDSINTVSLLEDLDSTLDAMSGAAEDPSEQEFINQLGTVHNNPFRALNEPAGGFMHDLNAPMTSQNEPTIAPMQESRRQQRERLEREDPAEARRQVRRRIGMS